MLSISGTPRDLAARATALSEALAPDWPAVAVALTGPVPEQRLFWLVCAAQDLLDGRSHDGAPPGRVDRP